MRSLRFLGLFVFALLSGSLAHAQYVAGDSAATRKDGPPSRYAGSAAPASSTPSDNGFQGKPFFQRLSYGGNFALSFGTWTYVDVSPLALYNVNERLQVGPGLTYIYSKVTQGGYTTSGSVYGGRLLGRYIVYQDFFVQSENEVLNIEVQNKDHSGRYTIFNPYVGGGYRAPIGSKGGIYLTALYNLHYIPNKTIYQSPFVWRVGFAL